MARKYMQRLSFVVTIVLSSMVCEAGEPAKLGEAWKAYCSEKLPNATQILDKVAVKSVSDSFQVAYLRARIAAAVFKKFYHENDIGGRTLKPDEARRKDELSLAVTRRYEDAYKAAPSRHMRACVTAEWWPLYAHYQFPNNSKVLMQASPTALAKNVSSSLASKITRQKRVFRAVSRGTLDIVQATQNMEEKRKDAFADSLSKEFASFAVVDLPEPVFAELLRNVPVYMQDYMWSPDAVASPATYRNTMRWDLWRAVTLIQPNDIEAQAIRSQTLEFARMVGDAVDDLIAHAKVRPQGKSYSQRARRAYERMCDNRFVPYFRRYLLRYERRKCQEMLLLDWKQVKRSWQSDLADWRDEPKAVPDSKYEEAAGRYQVLVYSLGWLRFTHYRHPAWEGAIPNEKVVLCGGRLNRNQVMSFTVQKVTGSPAPRASTQPR